MEAQLRLLSPADEVDHHEPAPDLEPGPTIWRLSASTRAVGREGIESARAALRQARPAGRDPIATDPTAEPATSRRSAA
jgi:hypothetical protein